MSKKLKVINIICLVVVITGIFSGCSSKNVDNNKKSLAESKKISFSNISAEKGKKRLDSEKGIILLDVRTKEEYDTGHIKGSILIPVDNLKEEAPKSLRDTNAVIFVYCRSGNRSVTAADILVNLGYKKVYNLGGIINWPYEVVK